MATLQPYKIYNSVAYDYATELPDGWQLWKIAHAFNLIGSGTTPQSGNISFYESGTINWINTGDLNDGVINECKNKITELAFKKHSVLKIYPKGTLLVAMYGATIGKAAVMNLEGCTNQACCALSKSKILTNKFTLYWFIANRKNIVNLSYGGGQPNISQDVIKKLKIPVPPLEVQNSIVAYLDKKNSEIDKFIRNKERLVELLEEEKINSFERLTRIGINNQSKLKPSGVSWIGDINEEWELRKVSHSFKKIGSGTTPTSGANEYYNNGIHPWVNTGDLNDGYLNSVNTLITKKALKDYPTLKQYPENTLLIAMYGATIGKVSILQIKACTNQACCALVPHKYFDTEYIYYWFKGNRNKIISLSYGGGQPNISQDVIRNIRIPCPLIGVQQEIVQQIILDEERLNLIISKAQKEISSIKEYREALITDLVTGSRSVPQLQLN